MTRLPMKTFLIMVLALSCGIGASAKEIKGSVFIVTRGGQAIKLALAQIYVVTPTGIEMMRRQQEQRAAELREQIRQNDIKHEAAVGKLQARVDEKAAAVAKARGELEKFEAEVHRPLLAKFGTEAKISPTETQAAQDWSRWRWQEQTHYSDWTILSTAAAATQEALERESREMGGFIAELRIAHSDSIKNIEAQMRELAGPPEGLPPATLADADGKFTVTAAATEFIYIHAARSVPAERYDWLVPVKAIAGDVMLFSNHNLYQGELEGKH